MVTQSILNSIDKIDGIMSVFENPFLFGNDVNADILNSILKQGNLSHALLFEGIPGIGKSGYAFQFSWNLLKKNSSLVEALDIKDPIYLQMISGVNPNFLYIGTDYDSNKKQYLSRISIDQIRKIVHFLSQTSLDKSWRIILIDRLNDLTYPAANALLKILEEPPEKSLFILISQGYSSELKTIQSRCQRFFFHPLSEKNLIKSLKNIAEFNSLPAEEYLPAVQFSKGSVREAILFLKYGGAKLLKTVDMILSKTDFSHMEALDLATSMSSKTMSTGYFLLHSCLLHWLSQKTYALIRSHRFKDAFLSSCLWQNLQNEFYENKLYNLDRKQAILLRLNRMHQTFNTSGIRLISENNR